MNPPPIPENFQWLNTDRRFTWEDLKGHVVVLDFWTYCCINCLHVLPLLDKIERKYKDQPVIVIGVHSAKFENEKAIKNIESAIVRHHIEHPVIVDEEHEIWESFAIKAWPSLVIIDSNGKISSQTQGEDVEDFLEENIQELLAKGRAENTLAAKKLTWIQPNYPDHFLSFPSKLTLDEKNKHLWVSDHGHHRVLGFNLISPDEAEVKFTIGNANAGFKDGTFDQAQLRGPQGLYFDAPSQKLYICDTENHSIRRADLKKETLETIAGTGIQGSWRSEGGVALETPLNSPWDCVLAERRLFIAMAGCHQLWCLDLDSQEIKPFSGSGVENLADGPAFAAQLAQPSGLSSDGEKLYFADAEVSAIRECRLDDGEVKTIVGEGLFDFGHADGPFDEALFQHCLGVHIWKGLLFVADTYNHAVRLLDMQNKNVISLIYTHETDQGICMVGQEACVTLPLNEPNDVVVFYSEEEKIPPLVYIADTNNHLIRVYDLSTNELSDLKIRE